MKKNHTLKPKMNIDTNLRDPNIIIYLSHEQSFALVWINYGENIIFHGIIFLICVN